MLLLGCVLQMEQICCSYFLSLLVHTFSYQFASRWIWTIKTAYFTQLVTAKYIEYCLIYLLFDHVTYLYIDYNVSIGIYTPFGVDLIPLVLIIFSKHVPVEKFQEIKIHYTISWLNVFNLQHSGQIYYRYITCLNLVLTRLYFSYGCKII